jgi:hypothetical protein
MKGIKFTVLGEVSKEAKAKLDLMMAKREERLIAMIEDYRSGRFADVIENLPKNSK